MNSYHDLWNKNSNFKPNETTSRLEKLVEELFAVQSQSGDKSFDWDNVWSIIDRFLEDGRYHDVITLLKKAQSRTDTAGLVSEVLLVAEHLCRLCGQYQTEVQRCRQSAEQAGQLELDLRQQLQRILNQTGDRPAPAKVPAPRIRVDFKIYCFGQFQLFYDNQSISEWNSQKARSVFKYLVAHHDRPVPKDVLMDLFWPNASIESARRNLHQAIYCLRHTLRQKDSDVSPILFENDCYLLNPELNIWIDAVEFKERIEAGRVLEQAGKHKEAAAVYELAEKLYAGDFLADDLFEEWPYVQREHLRSIYLDVTSRLSDYYLAQQDYTRLIHLGQKVLRHDNCYEDAHRWLMWGYLARGQRQLALRQYLQCVETLKTELDVSPSPETQTIYLQIAEGHDSLVLAGLEAHSL
ncbi:MAG: winged helix-turn-helix domain-containing protein [Anaerolineae bacterium]|nr:winged helix-turn-helix domain-containing protein [Anaerolineae bacterium]